MQLINRKYNQLTENAMNYQKMQLITDSCYLLVTDSCNELADECHYSTENMFNYYETRSLLLGDANNNRCRRGQAKP